MMMKKLVLLLICTGIFNIVRAQHAPIMSVEIGVGISGHSGTDSGAGNSRMSEKLSFNVDIPINEFLSFQTGIGMARKGAVNMYDKDMKVRQNYLQMPFLAALHVGTPVGVDFVFCAGPYFAYGISGNFKYVNETATFKGSAFEKNDISGFSGYRRYDAGLELSFKADVEHWCVGASFDCGMIPLSGGASTNNYGLYLTAGYKF